MQSCNFPVILFFQLVILVAVTVQNDMCGMPAPDPAKTCISVRLPWNPAPMYFCTDKSTFRFRNQCQNRFSNQCGLSSIRQDTLMVATPWDCCPLTSFPDSCVNQQCPPAPLNRKCQTMEPSPSSWECCNSYFCEENMTPDTCHFKRLEPTCNMPPQGKTNCIAFVDPYGCCPKFQCDGDRKPGHCPAEVEAMKLMARFNSTNMLMMGGPGMPMMMPPSMTMGPAGASGSPAGQAEMYIENKPADSPGPPAEAPPAPAPPSEPTAPPAERNGGFAGRPASMTKNGSPQMGSSFIALPGLNQQNLQACISDQNCPSSQICCSHDMNVYVMDGHYLFRNRNPTYGYCMDPAVMTTNTKTIKYVSQ